MIEILDRLSQREFIERWARSCPACKGRVKIVQTDSDILREEIIIKCKCQSCGATWLTVYVLTGYRNLEVGK